MKVAIEWISTIERGQGHRHGQRGGLGGGFGTLEEPRDLRVTLTTGSAERSIAIIGSLVDISPRRHQVLYHGEVRGVRQRSGKEA